MRLDDVSQGVWTIRSDDGEKGNAGELRLPKMALDIIDTLSQHKDNPHMFPAARGDGPQNSFSQRKRELDALMPKGTPRWRLHDLRRTARTLMAQLGIDDRVAERTLGHKLQGIEAVYNKHKYFNEKSDALRRLAILIGSILDPTDDTNVISIKGSRTTMLSLTKRRKA
jgi:integrase